MAATTVAHIRAALQSPASPELLGEVKKIFTAAPSPLASTKKPQAGKKKKEDDMRLTALLALKNIVGVTVYVLAVY